MLGRPLKSWRQIFKRALVPYGKPWAPREEWSIGIYAGTSLQLTTPSGVRNPILTPLDVTDVPAATVADPFMLRMDQVWHMFFEVLNNRTNRGEIGLATSRDGYSPPVRNRVPLPAVRRSGGRSAATPR